MTDRFDAGRRSLEEVRPRNDLWEHVERRAAEPARTPLHEQSHPKRLVLVAAVVVVLAAAAGMISLVSGADDREVDTGPAAAGDDHPAITVPVAAPCGPVTVTSGPVEVREGSPASPVFPNRADVDWALVAHATDGAQQLELHVPGIVLRDLVGERVEQVKLARGEHPLWITDEFVQVRAFTGAQDQCSSFTVTASGGTENAQREAAVALAERVVLATDDGRSEPGDQPDVDDSPNDDSFAIWPETDRIELSAEEAPWSLDMEDTALVFAEMVLGWDDAVVTDREPSEDGRRGGILSVESPERNGHTAIFVAPMVGDRYRVYGVDSIRSEESYASVSVQGSTASADAGPPPPGTASARVRFAYDGRATEGPAGEELQLVAPPSGAGSVLVLFLDAAGEVIGAWGTPLRSGDFAAG